MKLEFVSNSNLELIKAIENQFPKLNFNQIKMALRKKDIKINGKRVSTNVVVQKNSLIEVFLPNPKPVNVQTLFEDDNILICFKPAGMETTLQDKAFDSPCLEEIFPYRAMHRLDKNTEGLVVMAKNPVAYQALFEAFKRHQIKKHYLAIVSGKPLRQAHLVAYLQKDAKNNRVKVYKTQQPQSVQIKTNYTLVKTVENLSLLDVELVTGKTHQIRAHLASENLKILGDEKYGDKLLNKEYKQKKQCLCAYKLEFCVSEQSPLCYLNDAVFEVAPTFSLEDIADKHS